MELVPVFALLGLLLGGRRSGIAVAVAAPVVFWTVQWVLTDGDVYGDGQMDVGMVLLLMVGGITFAACGVMLRQVWRFRSGG